MHEKIVEVTVKIFRLRALGLSTKCSEKGQWKKKEWPLKRRVEIYIMNDMIVFRLPEAMLSDLP